MRSFPECRYATQGLLLALAAISGLSGCTLLTKRGPTPEYLAQARHLWRRGVDALELGKLPEAESLLRKATEATPDDPDARGHLADALWQRGAHDEAIVHAEAVCVAEPTDLRAALRAGQMRLDQGDAGASLRWANKAISLDVRSPEAWALRGRAHQRTGDAERALADLYQSLRYAPNDTELLTDIALLHRAQGDSRRCLATLHHLLDGYPPGEGPPEVLALAGESYLAMNRPHEAAEKLRLAAELGTGGADFYYRLAEAEAACGRTDQAITGAEKALSVNANHAPSRDLLVRLADANRPARR